MILTQLLQSGSSELIEFFSLTSDTFNTSASACEHNVCALLQKIVVAAWWADPCSRTLDRYEIHPLSCLLGATSLTYVTSACYEYTMCQLSALLQSFDVCGWLDAHWTELFSK